MAKGDRANLERLLRSVWEKQTGLLSAPSKISKGTVSRSTFEAYVGIIGGLGYSALTGFGIPINFWFGLGAWAVVTLCFLDLIWRSPQTVQRPWIKILLTVVVGCITILLLTKGWANTHEFDSASLRRLSNEELKQRGTGVCDGLFDLEHKTDVELEHLRSTLPNHPVPSEEMHRILGEYSETEHQINNSYLHEFRKRYLQPTCALRDELFWRLSKKAGDAGNDVLSQVCSGADINWGLPPKNIAGNTAKELGDLIRQIH